MAKNVVDVVRLTSACVDLAERAGSLLRALAEKNYNVNTAVNKKEGHSSVDQSDFQMKAPQALLTEADLEAQRLIVGGLMTAFPDLPIVGEEDDSLAGEKLPEIQPNLTKLNFAPPPSFEGAKWSDFCAFVDPLDGTKQFCLSKFFAVSVLIGVTYKGTPTIGVIHEPWREGKGGVKGYTTWDVVGMERSGGQHVWWPGVDGRKEEDRGPLVIAVGDKPMKAVLGHVVEELKEKREGVEGEWEGEEGEWLIHVGATGHKMAKMARGEANCYLQDPNACCRWDICAGEAIFRARGGFVSDLNGDDYEYEPFAAANQENDGGVLALARPQQHLKHVLGVTKNNFEECDVLRHTNGKKITDGWFRRKLEASGINTTYIYGFTVDLDSVVKMTNSHTVFINIHWAPNAPSPHPPGLFLKRIVCKDLPPRDEEKWDVDVKSYSVESNFLEHFSPFMEDLVHLPHVYYTEHNTLSPSSDSSFLTLAELLKGWEHEANFQPKHAFSSLSLLAAFHSTTWDSEERLALAKKEMWERGSYWELSKRPAKEMEIDWEKFLSNFSAYDEDFFKQEEVKNMAKVTRKWEKEVNERLWDKKQNNICVIHGDYKAANIFFREKDGKEEANMIDFQWSGVGCPAQDVSCFIISSIPITEIDQEEDKEQGLTKEQAYEKQLLEHYYASLPSQIKEKYSFSSFVVDYKLSFFEVSRFSMAYFIWKCTPESMLEIRNHLPAGLQRKSPQHCMWMLKRHLSILKELEETGDVSDQLFTK